MNKEKIKKKFPVGTPVIYTVEVDVYPHDIIKEGETGVVSFDDDNNFYVKLDADHPELADWENQHIFNYLNDDEHILDQIDTYNPMLKKLNDTVVLFETVRKKYTKRGADDTHSREVFWEIIWTLKKNKTNHIVVPNTPDGWRLYSFENHQQKLENKSAVVDLHEATIKVVKLIKRTDAKILNEFYAQYKTNNK